MLFRKRISVVLITFNQAKLLVNCLASVNWADEIIVLDNNSVDATKNIAIQAGAQVFHSNNWSGFGKQRQRAQKYANGDYILMIDADERVTPQLRQNIIDVLYHPLSNVVYSIPRQNIFLGYNIKHGGWYPDRVIRLYEREKYLYNSMLVHESLDIRDATVINLKGELLHFTCSNLLTFQDKQLKYAAYFALEKFYQGKTCSFFNIIKRTYITFFKMWLFRTGFLDGKIGWILAMITSQYTFNKYTILWILNNINNRKHSDY